MPPKPIEVVFYQDSEGCPVLNWLETIEERARAKGIVRIELLVERGHELRRPEADYLGDGIYELRWRVGHVNDRILYFFHGREVVVLAHSLTKERRLPVRDLSLAVRRKALFSAAPHRHTHYESSE